MIPILMLLLPLLTTGGGTSTPQACGLLSGQIANTISQQEPWYCPISAEVTAQWEKWLPVMLIVTLISFLLSAIIVMAGQALGSTKVRNYGIAEFYEAIATAIIVAAFVYVCAVLFGLGPGILVANINPYVTAFHLIGGTITNAQSMYASIYNIYFFLSGTMSVKISISGPETGLLRGAGGNGAVNAATGAETYSSYASSALNAYNFLVQLLFIEPANAISKLLLDGVAVLYGEYYLLVFFEVAAIPCFIIPGVIFRALLPTRGLGGVMIAMGIGFYLVMPSLFATIYYFTAPSFLTQSNIANSQIKSLPLSGGMITSPQSPLVQDFNNSQSALNGFWMLILFWPILIIAFTYSFVTQLSQLIGGTYQSAAMGRLRRFI
jgi:hypothetical protein